MSTEPETPPPGVNWMAVAQFGSRLAGLIAQEREAEEAVQLRAPGGRLILGMEAARDLLLAEAAVWEEWGTHRDAYELSAQLLDRKITNLKEGA